MASKGFKGAAQSAWRSCEKSGWLLEGKKLLSLPHLFVSPSTSQLLSTECHSHHSPCSAQCRNNKLKTRYVVSSGVYLLIIGMKRIVHLGLQRPTVNAANESCGQTLPTILVLVISLLLFPSSPLKPNCLEYRNSFPAFLTSFHALSASEWIGI